MMSRQRIARYRDTAGDRRHARADDRAGAAGGDAPADHRDRPVLVRVDRGSADGAGRIASRLRARLASTGRRNSTRRRSGSPTTGAGAARRSRSPPGRGTAVPRWSPDGTRLAFVRAAETEGRVQPPQIYVMAMTGGEPRAVTDIPRGAGAPAWAPDSKAIAFSSSARPDELPGADKAAAKPSNGEGAKRADRRSRDHRCGLPRQRRLPAPVTSMPIARRTSGSRRCRTATPSWPRAGHDRRIRRRQPPVVPRRQRHLLRLESPARGLLLSRRQRSLRRVAPRRRAAASRRHRRQHRPVRGLPRRQAHRLHRRGERQTRAVLRSARPLGRRSSPAARRATSPPPTTSTSAARSAAISARRAASIRRRRSGAPPGRASSFASASRATPCSRRWMRRRDASIAPSRRGTSCRTPRTPRAGVSPP